MCNAARESEGLRLGGTIWTKSAANHPVNVSLLETSGSGIAEMRAAKEELKASLRYSSIRDLLDGAGANSSSDAICLRTESGTAAIAAADRAGARAIEEQLCFASLWAGASRDETRDRILFEADGAAGRSGSALPRELGFASRWSAANSRNIATR